MTSPQHTDCRSQSWAFFHFKIQSRDHNRLLVSFSFFHYVCCSQTGMEAKSIAQSVLFIAAPDMDDSNGVSKLTWSFAPYFERTVVHFFFFLTMCHVTANTCMSSCQTHVLCFRQSTLSACTLQSTGLDSHYTVTGRCSVLHYTWWGQIPELSMLWDWLAPS